MSINIEYEERVMISEDHYYALLTPLLRRSNDHSFIMQTNIYIDTPDFYLKEHHMVLRIRIIQPFDVEMTLKVKGKDGDTEHNQQLTYQDYQAYMINKILPEGDINSLLRETYKIDLSLLEPRTSLDTRRYEEKIDDYLLVLDKNTYNGIEDYNLEIEASSMKRAKEVMQKICDEQGIEFIHCKSKSRRAFDSIKK